MVPAKLKQTGVRRDWRQWALLAVAIACFASGFFFKLVPVGDESVRLWAFNILVKVAVVLLTMAIAWPQILFLNSSGYGRVIIGGLLVTAMFFMIRPRAVTGIVPIIAVCVGIVLAVTFLRNFFSSPRNK